MNSESEIKQKDYNSSSPLIYFSIKNQIFKNLNYFLNKQFCALFFIEKAIFKFFVNFVFYDVPFLIKFATFKIRKVEIIKNNTLRVQKKQLQEKKYHRPGVSQDEIAELRETFELFDTQKTGSLEVSELKHAITSISNDRKNKMMQQILDKLDKMNNERIEFEEFLDLMTGKMNENSPKEDIMRVFQLFDHQSKGNIDLEDLKRVAMELGEDMTDEELKEMIEKVDMEGKGYVTADEFYNIMTKNSTFIN
ncbi:centrin [Reticulomyxa filosa]|uniref:Centrin n=1 Tax=Reticulomyxa filosa TaxID=46433 RepID=X6PDT9_RETFI|nr:centrin [Reticulomyxa filosa]|eukprot:ETO36224.1 centrin [Reticulomyxa filosa]